MVNVDDEILSNFNFSFLFESILNFDFNFKEHLKVKSDPKVALIIFLDNYYLLY